MGQHDADMTMERSSDDVTGTLETMLRAACIIVSFGVFLMAAYYAIHVFGQVGKLVADPAVASKSVDAIATMIDADKLKLPARDGKTVDAGRSVAYGLMLITYVLWMWVPLVLLKVTGHIILKSLPARQGKKTER